MSKYQLLTDLISRISADERRALEEESDGLVISKYNRKTVQRMLSFYDELPDAEKLCGDGTVDLKSVEELEDALASFLNRYMAEQPEGHKWIVICCVFLAFIVEEPMHPMEVVHWVKEGESYYCSYREETDGSLCRCCVSKKKP